MIEPLQYLRQVRQELDKVSWPSLPTTRTKTMVVVAVSLVLALYLGLADHLFQRLMSIILYS